MQILVAPIEDDVLGEKTTFSSELAAGSTSVVVTSVQNYAAGDFLILNTIGSDTAEIRKISTVTAATKTIVVTEATSFKHLAGEDIQLILFDQRKFYRSTSETGTYSHLSVEGSPVNIDVDQPDGNIFEDSSGTATSWYKVTYYNSATDTETLVADSIAELAGDGSHYTSVYKIRVEAGFKNNDYLETDLIERYREEAESEVDSMLASQYVVPFTTVPKMIQHITTLLSAGYLLAKEYGIESDVEQAKSGDSKIKRAEELLEKIQNGKLLLLDSTGAVLTQSTANQASCSNTYDEDVYNKGELFTLEDEPFRAADPTDGAGSTQRNTIKITGFN